MVNEKFKPQHNKTILLFQYCNLDRKIEEATQEYMGRLQIKATECKCKKKLQEAEGAVS